MVARLSKQLVEVLVVGHSIHAPAPGITNY